MTTSGAPDKGVAVVTGAGSGLGRAEALALAALAQVRAEQANVYCRVTPAQKARLLGALKARGRIVGSEHYLTKPFTKDELLNAIETHVGALTR